MATLTMRKQQRGMRRNLKSWIVATALLIALVTTSAMASAPLLGAPTATIHADGFRSDMLRFEDDFQVPPSIDRNNVTTSASAVTDSPPGTAGASIDFVGPENDEPEITLRDFPQGNVG
jgi:hypothetical protein